MMTSERMEYMTQQEMIARVCAFPLEKGEITDVKWVAEVKMPEPNPLKIQVYNPGGYVWVDLALHPTDKSNILVAVGLPDESYWNGNLLGTGNGGSAGAISPGSILSGVSRGYVTVTTNMGTSVEPYDCIGNAEIMKDFGYRATHLMTVVAKELTRWTYGKLPQYSYFCGGSTGGQQGMMEAQRYPEDYDGIVCLSPAYDRIRLHAFFVWNWQRIHEQEDATFTREQAQAWRSCIERVYREECGGAPDEAFLRYPGRIQENPMDNPALQDDIARVLTPGQAKALRAIYDGPMDPVTGKRFIAHFLPGTETEMLSLAELSDKDTFAHGYFFPFYWAWGRDFDFMKFDFHGDLQRAIRELSPILDADNPDLSAFKARGGKLLVVGGSSDAIIPYTGFLDYYRKVINLQESMDETKKFFRFFLMPGFGHTLGGNGVKDVGTLAIDATPRDPQHDVVCAIAQWVEEGIAPERLLGTNFTITPEGIRFMYDLPAFSYPNITEFIGGNPKDHDCYISRNSKE